MKKVVLYFGLVLLPIILYGQYPKLCGVSDVFEENRYTYIGGENKNLVTSIDDVITIPVVVHVIYHDPIENIPDSLIIQRLDLSNKDFRRQNSDTINTPTEFKSLAADSKIQFCLASIDPQGNSTSGITRTYTDTTYWSVGALGSEYMKFDSTGGKDAWNTSNYLNIWVANIIGAGGLSSSIWSHGGPWDGIVMSYIYMNNSHLLTHELGHYLDLLHIWGNGSNMCYASDSSDFVFDTPDQYGPSFGCPTFPQTDSCTQSYPGIMFMNYMDYTDDNCQNMFTIGQINRMRNAINNVRFSLLNSNGCSLLSSITQFDRNQKYLISIFPNPLSSFATLTTDNALYNATLKIVNLYGQTVRQIKNISGKTLTMHRDNLPSGLYFIRITQDNKIISTNKIIITD